MRPKQPFRHGHRHSNMPAPAMVDRRRASQPHAQAPTRTAPEPARQVVPVRLLDAFLTTLPSSKITPVVFTAEKLYDPSLVQGASIQVDAITVPQNQAYVITDVNFYATTPGPSLLSPPELLSPVSLLGLLRFDLRFANTTPFISTQKVVSPYASSNNAQIERSGWSFVDRAFGPQRALTFALYAKEQQDISATVHVEAPPRFTITKVGVAIHGFSVPSAQLKAQLEGLKG